MQVVKLEQGSIEWKESTGAGIDKALNILASLERHMAVLGIGMLTGEPRTNETAEARRIDKAEQDSVVASTVASVEDALNTALGINAEFLSLDDGGSVILNRTFRGDADEIIRGATGVLGATTTEVARTNEEESTNGD